jgi:hypothetical protein
MDAAMPIMEILETLGFALQPRDLRGEAMDGPDYPFTYLRGHPSFPTIAMPVSGPYRLVVAKDRLQYTGKGRGKVIFQLPKELVKSIRGQGGQLTIRLADEDEWVDIDFLATGLTRRRDMKRLIAAIHRSLTPPRR